MGAFQWPAAIKLMEAELWNLDDESRALLDRRTALQAKIAEAKAALCPYPIGSLAQSRNHIYRLTRVRFYYGDKWEAWGQRRLKDGSFGEAVHRLHTYWTPLPAGAAEAAS